MTAKLNFAAVKAFLALSLDGLHVGAKIKPFSSPYLTNWSSFLIGDSLNGTSPMTPSFLILRYVAHNAAIVACIFCIFCFSLSILIASSRDSTHQCNESSGEDSFNGSK
jgi:hypothetical protein